MSVVEQGEVMRKWYMNFMLLLLFAAEVQRPQTDTKLKAPTEGENSEMKNQASTLPFFEVQTLSEKRSALWTCHMFWGLLML